MIYRAVQKLSWGDELMPPGAVFPGDRLKAQAAERLLAAGAIAAVQTPPLALVPGWRHRAARLGDRPVEEVLEMPAADLAGAFGVLPATAERWQRELLDYFAALAPERQP